MSESDRVEEGDRKGIEVTFKLYKEKSCLILPHTSQSAPELHIGPVLCSQ